MVESAPRPYARFFLDRSTSPVAIQDEVQAEHTIIFRNCSSAVALWNKFSCEIGRHSSVSRNASLVPILYWVEGLCQRERSIVGVQDNIHWKRCGLTRKGHQTHRSCSLMNHLVEPSFPCRVCKTIANTVGRSKGRKGAGKSRCLHDKWSAVFCLLLRWDAVFFIRPQSCSRLYDSTRSLRFGQPSTARYLEFSC